MNERPAHLIPDVDPERAADLLRRLRDAKAQLDPTSPLAERVRDAMARLAVIEPEGDSAATAPDSPQVEQTAPPAPVQPRRERPRIPPPPARSDAGGSDGPGPGASSLADATSDRQDARSSVALSQLGPRQWLLGKLDGETTEVQEGVPTANGPQARERLMAMIRPATVAGLALIGIAFGVFGVWAAVAPLSGAAIATGVVSPDSSRKTIQHLEGGIIKEILVRDGDTVAAGQTLYRLEVTQAQASYGSKREQWLRLLATRARLEAHAQDAARMTLPPELSNLESVDLKAFVDNQLQLFELRRRGLEERENILQQQLRQLEEQTRGKALENEGLDLQLKLLEEEAEDKATLIRQKLARKPEYLAVQRTIAEVKARMGSNIATIGSFNERMGEIRLQINSNRTQFRDQNAEMLTKTNNDIAQVEESLVASQDILRRTEILAPASGTVLNMRFKTVGGVIRPGEPVVDLVPKEDVLIVDARLPATDIDVVRAGLPALVHLVPYLTRDTPMLEAVVTQVSADSNVDQQSGQRFYELKVKVDKSKLDQLAHPVELSPGMPVEVFVRTRDRTALGYMIEPLTRSIRRAFRED